MNDGFGPLAPGVFNPRRVHNACPNSPVLAPFGAIFMAKSVSSATRWLASGLRSLERLAKVRLRY